MKRAFLIILLFWLIELPDSSAQGALPIPSIYPSAFTTYDIEDGLPVFCLEEVFLDPAGRLWLNPCRHMSVLEGDLFFQFDTKRSYVYTLTETDGQRPSSTWFVKGINDAGQIFGANLNLDLVFLYEQAAGESEIFTFREQERVITLEADENGLLILTQGPSSYFIYRASLEGIEELHAIPLLMSEGDFDFLTPSVRMGSVLWFLHENEGFVRYDLQSNSSKLIRWEELTGVQRSTSYFVNFTTTDQGTLLFYKDYQFFDFDPVSEKLSPNNRLNALLQLLPSEFMASLKFHKDQSGNILFNLLWDTPEDLPEQALWLLDEQGQLFDYTPVMATVSRESRYGSLLPESVSVGANWAASSNFKKEALISSDAGFFAIEIETKLPIEARLQGRGARGIVEQDQHTLLVTMDDSHCQATDLTQDNSMLEADDLGRFLTGDSYATAPYSQIIHRGQGWVWFASEQDELIGCNISERSARRYSIGHEFDKFTFLDDKTVALVTTSYELYTYDLDQRTLRPFIHEGVILNVGGAANELIISRDGQLLIASTNGLWRIDPSSKEVQHIHKKDGLLDDRVVCIYEATDGRWWLGLMAGGLHLYDPADESIQIVDVEEGLSNNTVVGILPDEDGDIWVSTFSGITVLSADGSVLFKMQEKDGLSHREFNRYSYLKMSGGRLVFGSVSGINVFYPELIKPLYLEKRGLQLYLTEVSYFDPELQEDFLQVGQFEEMGEIILPANQRYLSVNFATSDYVHSESTTYTYQVIRGNEFDPGNIKESNWISIGNNSSLSLNNLPIGEHQLVIRGTDHKGQHIDELIIVPFRVKQFFYKTAWFYLLCSIPIILIVFLWVRRILTEKKRLTEEVEKRTRVIQEDKLLIEQQAAELKEMDVMKSRFFTNISHEFRTPLTVISGMAGQIKNDPDKWLSKGIDLIQRNSQQLLSLINQILDLRKLESGALKVNMVQADIMPYLAYIVESFSPMALAKGVKVHFLQQTEELSMDHDPDKLLHILSNLLSNAIKYTDQGDDIYIIAEQQNLDDSEVLFIQVRDTGQGISPEALPHIFDRFYQVENLASQKPQGSEIGLALTKELIKVLHGTITAGSTPGKGTTFEVRFPVSRSAPLQAAVLTANAAPGKSIEKEVDVVPQVAAETNSPSAASAVNDDAPTCLIVEDNDDVRLYLRAALEKNYRILEAVNGQEGIDNAIELVPDLIVSDVMMPVKDGFALCDALKMDERTSHIPIVLLTAKADFQSKLDGLQRGADAYLPKPFNEEELLVRLEQLLALRKKLQERYSNLSQTLPIAENTAQNMEDVFIGKIRQLILDNLSDDSFGTPHLYRALGISRTQLYNKVKALTGEPVSTLVRSIKMDKARGLLLQTNLNVSEVAYEVGINNPAYFSRIYAETFGESPSESRKKA